MDKIYIIVTVVILLIVMFMFYKRNEMFILSGSCTQTTRNNCTSGICDLVKQECRLHVIGEKCTQPRHCQSGKCKGSRCVRGN